jgi:hypothetical protein
VVKRQIWTHCFCQRIAVVRGCKAWTWLAQWRRQFGVSVCSSSGCRCQTDVGMLHNIPCHFVLQQLLWQFCTVRFLIFQCTLSLSTAATAVTVLYSSFSYIPMYPVPLYCSNCCDSSVQFVFLYSSVPCHFVLQQLLWQSCTVCFLISQCCVSWPSLGRIIK